MDQDECWFSRFSHPQMHTWAQAGQETRLVERTPGKKEPDKAIACYGALCYQTKDRYLYFAEGQPNTAFTISMLERLLTEAQTQGKTVLVVIWDRATWHKSNQLVQWVRTHNRAVKQNGGVRLLTCLLPIKSPWLNPIEPVWLHAKRKIDQHDGPFDLAELKARLCSYFNVSFNYSSLKPSGG